MLDIRRTFLSKTPITAYINIMMYHADPGALWTGKMSSDVEIGDRGSCPLPVLIPVYNPDEELAALVQALLADGFERIVAVNDGSDEELLPLFEALNEKPNAEVLCYVVNQGKGAALKTGFNYLYEKLIWFKLSHPAHDHREKKGCRRELSALGRDSAPEVNPPIS